MKLSLVVLVAYGLRNRLSYMTEARFPCLLWTREHNAIIEVDIIDTCSGAKGYDRIYIGDPDRHLTKTPADIA